MLKMAAAGLADLPMTVILVAGQGRSVSEVGVDSLAENVMLKPHMPLSDLLPIADLVVTNGNSPSVMATLSAGIPLVVVPSIFDQNDVAWLVQDLKLGLRVSARKGTPAQLRTAVQRVLRGRSFRRRAKEFSALIGRCGGAARGAELVEVLAAQKAALRVHSR
jgi:UDP:flavonoid glycosyltransferase YjiC (YdhE family)